MDELYNECSYVSCIVDECNDVVIPNVYGCYTDDEISDILDEHPEWSVKCIPTFI